jgi:integrase
MQADHGDFVSRTLEEPHGVEVIFDWLGFVMSFAHHGQPPRSDALHHRVTPRSDVPYACMRMRLQKRKARPNMSQYYWRFGCPSTRVPTAAADPDTGMEADVAAGQEVSELGRLVGGGLVGARRRPEAAIRIPTPETVGQIMAAAEQWFAPLIGLCAFAGLRLGEAAGVQLADIDFLRRTLTVSRQVQRAGR